MAFSRGPNQNKLQCIATCRVGTACCVCMAQRKTLRTMCLNTWEKHRADTAAASEMYDSEQPTFVNCSKPTLVTQENICLRDPAKQRDCAAMQIPPDEFWACWASSKSKWHCMLLFWMLLCNGGGLQIPAVAMMLGSDRPGLSTFRARVPKQYKCKTQQMFQVA